MHVTRCWRRTACPLLIWLLTLPVFADNSAGLTTLSVPPGFEDLLAPRKTLADVYYGGRLLGALPIIYAPGTLRFTSPEQLTALIPDLISPRVVTAALSVELDSHAQRVCLYDGQEGCGRLEPAVAGVIFDENRFRVDVFVNPAYRLVNPAGRRKYLPPAQAGVSLIQTLGTVASGTRGGDNASDDYTIYGTSQMAFRENDLEIGWDYAKDNPFSISTLQLQREFEGRLYETGLVNTQGLFRFSSDRDIWGVRFGRSDSTRLDQNLTQGSPLEVFLPQRGRVDVLKDNRLIYSSLMEAGNHLLDTSSFPVGAYDVTIRVVNDTGRLVSESTRLFARQAQLPPMGEPWFALETGRIASNRSDRTLPKADGPWLTRGSVNVRLHDALAGSLALATLPGESLLEAGLFAMAGRLELSPGLMVASNGSHGARFNGVYRGDVGSVLLDYQQTWSSHDRDTDDYSLSGLSEEQAALGFNVGLFGGSASYRLSTRRDDQEARVNQHTLGYTRTVYRGLRSDIDLRLDFSAADDDRVCLVSLDWRWNTGHWNLGVRPQYEQRRIDGGGTSSVSGWQANARWDDRDLLADDLSAGVNVSHNDGGDILGMDVDYGSRLGSLGLSVSHMANRDTTSTTSYALAGSTSFLTDGRMFAIGGDRLDRSALVVRVNGAPETARFDVLVNGQRSGWVSGGQASVIPLTPFATYEVRLRESGAGFYDFPEIVREVTLYPGNVVTLDYAATTLRVVYGLALAPDGKPLAEARIRNVGRFSGTDATGLFQVEVPVTTRVLEFEHEEGGTCRISLDGQPADKTIINLGRSICQ